MGQATKAARLAATVLSLVLVALGAADAGASWSNPVTVAGDGLPGVPADHSPVNLETEANGRNTLAWIGDGDVVGQRIEADGSLEPRFPFTPDPAPDFGGFYSLQLALASDGDGAVILPVDDFSDPIPARSVAADGTLGPVRELGPGPAHGLAVNEAGTAVATWLDTSDQDTWTIGAREMTQDGTLGATREIWSVPVAGLSSAGRVTPIYGADGTLTLAWEWDNDSGAKMVQARQVSTGGVLGPLKDLSAAADPTGFAGLGQPSLAAGPSNSITAVWQRRSGTNWVIETRTIGSDGSLGTTHELASASYPSSFLGSDLDVAVAPDGTATAAWTRRLGDDSDPREIAEMRTIASNGTLGSTQVLSPEADETGFLQVEVDSVGTATTSWESINYAFGEGVTTLQARQIQPNGTLGSTQTLDDGEEINGEPEVGISTLTVAPSGVVTVVWLARIPTQFQSENLLKMARFEPGPDTQIDSGPSGATNQASPAFTFSSPDATTGFECRLDAEPGFTACASPKALAGLGDTVHTFRVRAKDATYSDPSPATRSFTVDTAPPETAIDKLKVNQGKHKAIVRFSGSDLAPADPPEDFRCSLDEKPFKRCASPKVYKNLNKGRHQVEIEATDEAGNADSTPAKKKFRISN